MEYCTACGTPLGQGWDFCRRCGQAVGAEYSPQMPAQPYPPGAPAPYSQATVTQVPSTGPGRADVTAALVILAGVGLGIAALFPDFYHGGHSLASDNATLVYNLINFGGWALAAMLVLLARNAMGAWLAAGVTASTLGFYLLDTGAVARYGTHIAATGFWLGQANWVVCAAGTLGALYAARSRGVLGGIKLGPVALPLLAAVAGIGAAVAYAPGWDRYRIVAGTTGRSVSFTNPDAFHNPAAVIVGHVVVIVVLVVAPVLATLLQPGVGAAAALAGLAIPQVANVAQGLTGLLGSVAPATVGLTAEQVSSLRATLSVRATPWFWAEAVAVGLLLLVFLARVLTLRPEESR
jgi:hypothetical protein